MLNQILRDQGANPAAIRQRSPKLVDLAERAIEEGAPLLKPALLCRRLNVDHVIHERIKLDGGTELRSKLPTEHLAPASEGVFILCTIGSDLEDRISQVMKSALVYALALDGPLGNIRFRGIGPLFIIRSQLRNWISYWGQVSLPGGSL